MKYSTILIALLLISTVSGAFAVECTVMSFNIRFGTAKDGENAWQHRRDFLVETIKANSPDIIGTQESLDFQVEYIVSKLPDYAWIGLGRQADGTGEMTAIIYKKSLLVPIQTSHYWLSESPDIPGSKSWDSSLPRIVSRAKFFHQIGKIPFVVYNTHFDHRGEVARQESAKVLVKLMTAETLPVVLTGDFNALGANSAPWHTLVAGGFQDTWEIAKERRGPKNTWNAFKHSSAILEERRIDWIMVSPGLSVSQCIISDTHRDGRYPSDHFPVTATISLPSSTDTP